MDKTQEAQTIYVEALNAISQTYTEMGRAEILLPLLKSYEPVTEGTFLDRAMALDPLDQGKLIWGINKYVGDPTVRQRIGQILSEAEFKRVGIPQPESSEADVFARDGIVDIADLVTPSEAVEMRRYLESCQNLTRQETVLHHDIKDVARAPHAFRIATDPRILAIANRHIGAPATMVQMDAWWSLPERDEPHGAQIYHRDRDDFRSCKFFLYLSDVTAGDGPHIFVRGSHRPEGVAAALSAVGALPEKLPLFFNGHGREIAHLIDQVFGSSVMEITGGAGTCFVENTFGFHRGKVPKLGRRCIFQILYAGIPYPERIQRWSEANLTELPPGCADTPLARHAVRFAIS
ncbi:MAG: phytanoyl-CoA dioxygenase family protein [Rhodospirillaceae bacterium]